MKTLIRSAAWIVPVLYLFMWIGSPLVNVENGKVGIDLFFGQVQGARTSGWSFKMPFVEVIQMSTQTRPVNADAEAPTHDLQLVHTQLNSTWSILPSGAAKLYEAFGDEKAIQEAIIDPGMQEVTKAVSAKYDAYDLQQKRDPISIEARDAMRHWIDASLKARGIESGIDFATLLFPKVDFSKDFEEATQEQSRVEAAVPTSEKNRDTTVTNANAQAAAIVRGAEADVQKMRLDADAEADGMLAKAKAIKENPALLCYLVHKRWNGVVPEVVAGSNWLPFAEVCNAPAK